MRRGALAAVTTLVAAVAFAAPASASTVSRTVRAANATIVVDPATDLVNGQSVHVSGSGFNPNIALGSAECKAGPVSISDCDLRNTVFPETDATGAYAYNFTVHDEIGTANGPIDCTAADGACVISVADTTDLVGSAVTAPLAFAPTGPPQGGVLHPPTGRVAADTGVEITGTSFASNSVIETATCAAGATDPAQCEDPIAVNTDGKGAFDSFFDATGQLLTLSSDQIDCTVDGACIFAAWDFRAFTATLTTAPVRIAPEVPGSLTVTPSTGLHDGDQVALSGSGWPAEAFIELAECNGTDGTATCTNFDGTQTKSDGTFSSEFTVNSVGANGRVDCETGSCWIVATWFASHSDVTAAQPISFDTTPKAVTSHYTADELAAVSTAGGTLGISDEEVQHLGTWGLAWVLAITGTGTITPVPDTGPGTLTTNWLPSEYSALSAFAAAHGTTVAEFQKTGALFLAYILAIS